jgi:hypothetical protein
LGDVRRWLGFRECCFGIDVHRSSVGLLPDASIGNAARIQRSIQNRCDRVAAGLNCPQEFGRPHDGWICRRSMCCSFRTAAICRSGSVLLARKQEQNQRERTLERRKKTDSNQNCRYFFEVEHRMKRSTVGVTECRGPRLTRVCRFVLIKKGRKNGNDLRGPVVR